MKRCINMFQMVCCWRFCKSWELGYCGYKLWSSNHPTSNHPRFVNLRKNESNGRSDRYFAHDRFQAQINRWAKWIYIRSNSGYVNQAIRLIRKRFFFLRRHDGGGGLTPHGHSTHFFWRSGWNTHIVSVGEPTLGPILRHGRSQIHQNSLYFCFLCPDSRC